MSVRQLAYDFFESDELRTLFMRAARRRPAASRTTCPGLQGLVHNLPLVLSFEPAAIAVGGSQAISDALVSAGRKLGVEYFTAPEVGGDPRRGRARGRDRLVDGTSIGADVVVSGLGVPQTVLRLLPDHEIDHRLRHRIQNIHYDRGQLLWANIALHEPPDYSARRPIRRRPAAAAVLGAEGSRLHRHPLPAGDLPQRVRLAAVRAELGRHAVGPSRAPEGKHLVGVEEFAAPRRLFFSPGEWKALKTRFSEHLLGQWQRYAPNMTPDNVIAMRVYGPDDIEDKRPDMIEGGYSAGSTIASQLGRFRPVPELSGYRMLLSNLYNCSSNMHSGSGIGRGSSINCFNAIAADLGLSDELSAAVAAAAR